MGTHNICLYTEVDKKYSGSNLKTAELLDCVLIGVCAVIRVNTVCKVDVDVDDDDDDGVVFGISFNII